MENHHQNFRPNFRPMDLRKGFMEIIRIYAPWTCGPCGRVGGKRRPPLPSFLRRCLRALTPPGQVCVCVKCVSSVSSVVKVEGGLLVKKLLLIGNDNHIQSDVGLIFTYKIVPTNNTIRMSCDNILASPFSLFSCFSFTVLYLVIDVHSSLTNDVAK